MTLPMPRPLSAAGVYSFASATAPDGDAMIFVEDSAREHGPGGTIRYLSAAHLRMLPANRSLDA